MDTHSIGYRIAITFVIVLVILLVLALISYLGGRWEEAQAQLMVGLG